MAWTSRTSSGSRSTQETPVNRDALAYYRYESIVQDIAEYCEQFLDAPSGQAAPMPPCTT